jgi:hypothetical protein
MSVQAQEAQHALHDTGARPQTLQRRRGKGVLSPGGAPDPRRVLAGRDVAGRAVVDT